MTPHRRAAPAAGLFIAGLSACTVVTEPPVSRASYPQYFALYCAECHGADATGTAAAPDLTRLAARHGGVFPTTEVMNQIDGYGRGGAMPAFGAFLVDDRQVPVTLETGERTSAPERLVGMADYLESLQR